ncbi:MAG: efflux RND transporter periplasmic adaptor subunit [Acidobacteriota bacterium]|nr:efflux RND transporter periplasmic adaptor subunit [Blastocatellia bacterium]MDW8411325.1 efflux RND transporter periplasmic adaptor subunit [Acidobacteriota bacterium]
MTQYTLYAIDVIFIVAAGLLLFSQYLRLRISPPFLLQAAVIVSITVTAMWLVHLLFTIPRIERVKPISTESSDIVIISKEAQIMFGTKTTIVAEGFVSEKLRLTGYIRAIPQRRAEVVTPVAGKLNVLSNVTLGSSIRQGQILATLEQVLTTSDRTSVETARAEVSIRAAEAESQVKAAEAQLRTASAELERAQKLFTAGAAPLRRVQEAELQVDLAEAALSAAKKYLAVAQQTDIQPKVYNLATPLAGIVSRLEFSNGELVEAGQSLFTVVNLDRVWVEAQVFEKDLEAVLAATSATFSVVAFPNERFRINTAPIVSTMVDPDRRTIALTYEIANPQGRLKDGMMAEIIIEKVLSQKTLVIPKSAVFIEKGQHIVYVYNGGEQFTRRSITVGREGLEEYEVKSGLKLGERIVVEGANLKSF